MQFKISGMGYLTNSQLNHFIMKTVQSEIFKQKQHTLHIVFWTSDTVWKLQNYKEETICFSFSSAKWKDIFRNVFFSRMTYTMKRMRKKQWCLFPEYHGRVYTKVTERAKDSVSEYWVYASVLFYLLERKQGWRQSLRDWYPTWQNA